MSKINGLGKLVSSQFNFGILVYFEIPQLSRGNTLQLGHCSQITLGLIPLVAFHRLLLLGRISVAPPPKLPQTGFPPPRAPRPLLYLITKPNLPAWANQALEVSIITIYGSHKPMAMSPQQPWECLGQALQAWPKIRPDTPIWHTPGLKESRPEIFLDLWFCI